MTMLVAVSSRERGDGPLPLAAMLARSAGVGLHVVTVVPMTWSPGPARVDGEYQEYLRGVAHGVLEWARARVPSDVEAMYETVHARSTGAGIIDAASRSGASLVVLGSAEEGTLGRVALGSVNDRVLHTCPLPTAVSPAEFACAAGARVQRVTVAYSGTQGSGDLVREAATTADRLGAALRLVSFAVRPHTAYTAGVGFHSEDAVVDAWAHDIRVHARAALSSVRDAGHVEDEGKVLIGRGTTWRQALDDIAWGDGEVLIVGSSSSGSLARVFLGSRATKIVRLAPVPVVVLPRHR